MEGLFGTAGLAEELQDEAFVAWVVGVEGAVKDFTARQGRNRTRGSHNSRDESDNHRDESGLAGPPQVEKPNSVQTLIIQWRS